MNRSLVTPCIWCIALSLCLTMYPLCNLRQICGRHHWMRWLCVQLDLELPRNRPMAGCSIRSKGAVAIFEPPFTASTYSDCMHMAFCVDFFLFTACSHRVSNSNEAKTAGLSPPPLLFWGKQKGFAVLQPCLPCAAETLDPGSLHPCTSLTTRVILPVTQSLSGF